MFKRLPERLFGRDVVRILSIRPILERFDMREFHRDHFVNFRFRRDLLPLRPVLEWLDVRELDIGHGRNHVLVGTVLGRPCVRQLAFGLYGRLLQRFCDCL